MRRRRLSFRRYTWNRCVPWFRGTWSCGTCFYVLSCSSALLGNPVASSDPAIHLASFYIHPFLRSIPWNPSPLPSFPIFLHPCAHSKCHQTRRRRRMWTSVSSRDSRRVLMIQRVKEPSGKFLVSSRELRISSSRKSCWRPPSPSKLVEYRTWWQTSQMHSWGYCQIQRQRTY